MGKVANVTRIRYFPYYKWDVVARFITGARIEGSNDGVAYVKIGEVDQTAHAGWNTLQLTPTTSYRYIRLKHNNTSNCTIS